MSGCCCAYASLLRAAYALHPSSSRLSLALDALDPTNQRIRRDASSTCLDVIRHVRHSTPVDKTTDEEDDAALSTRFFDAQARATTVCGPWARGDDEAAAAVAASRPSRCYRGDETDAALDALDAVITSEATLAARAAALDDTRRDGLTDAPASDDERLASALAASLPPR